LSIDKLFGRVDGQRNGLKHREEIKTLKIAKDIKRFKVTLWGKSSLV
jgi:hypothetical protein